jgi:hypothetical protein
VFFERCDLLAHGAAHHAQLFGRPHNAAVPADGFKGADRIQGRKSHSYHIPENHGGSPDLGIERNARSDHIVQVCKATHSRQEMAEFPNLSRFDFSYVRTMNQIVIVSLCTYGSRKLFI